jgi:hypothetical protein
LRKRYDGPRAEDITGVFKSCTQCEKTKDLCEFPLLRQNRKLATHRKDICRKCVSENMGTRYRKDTWQCEFCKYAKNTRGIENCRNCGLPKD